MKKRKSNGYIAVISLLLALALGVVYNFEGIENRLSDSTFDNTSEVVNDIGVLDIPDYSGYNYIVLNNNEPEFDETIDTSKSFEKYSELDSFGRAQVAFGNIGKDLMPTEKRGSIGMIKPTGWHTVKYDIVDGKYLYNRCHLIGYQLTGENANPKNLITCTREMNTKGMLDFENSVADYIKKTNNHVLYRVTPIYKDDNLLASGVKIEAKSVEDNGEGIKFNVFVYNIQTGINIDYKTGSSSLK